MPNMASIQSAITLPVVERSHTFYDRTVTYPSRDLLFLCTILRCDSAPVPAFFTLPTMSLSEAIPQEIHQANSQVGASLTTPSAVGSSSVPIPNSNSAGQRLKEAQVFEFTKRKRWADLLVTELSEAIILVLSATCQVWYCGAAVTELLGWKDEDLVDVDLTDFMNSTFHSHLRG